MRSSDGNNAVAVGSDDGRGISQGRCLLLGEKLRQERLGTGAGHGIIFLILYLFSKDFCKSEQPLFICPLRSGRYVYHQPPYQRPN